MRKLIFALGTVLALFGPPALAKWKADYESADPKIVQWYHDQHNAKGAWCCDKSDGHPFYDDYTLNADGSVEFDFEGTHHHLPAYMVINVANPTGHAVWWFIDSTEAGHIDFCFALGGGM